MYQQKGRRTNFTEVPLSKVKSIIKEARGLQFPWNAIPEPTQSWLKAMAGAINTQPEFILLGALTVTSCLMGPECKVKIRPRHVEPCNIFTACLCEPGTGKTQAYKIAVETPLQDIPSKILVHDYTSKGLFEHLKTREGMVRTSIYTSAGKSAKAHCKTDFPSSLCSKCNGNAIRHTKKPYLNMSSFFIYNRRATAGCNFLLKVQ